MNINSQVNSFDELKFAALAQTPTSHASSLPPLKKYENITDFFTSKNNKLKASPKVGGFDYTGSKLMEIYSQRMAGLPK